MPGHFCISLDMAKRPKKGITRITRPPKINLTENDIEPGLIDADLQDMDLPLSARLVRNRLLLGPELGKVMAIQQFATLSSFLSLEAYLPEKRKDYENCSILSFLRRIRKAIENTVHSNDMDFQYFRYGLNALLQLSSIPDILSSPCCLRLFEMALQYYGLRCTFCALSGDDRKQQCVEISSDFLAKFNKSHAITFDEDYRDKVRWRYDKWHTILGFWMDEPKYWREKASIELKELSELEKNTGRTPPLDLPHEAIPIKKLARFYAKTLEFNHVEEAIKQAMES